MMSSQQIENKPTEQKMVRLSSLLTMATDKAQAKTMAAVSVIEEGEIKLMSLGAPVDPQTIEFVRDTETGELVGLAAVSGG